MTHKDPVLIEGLRLGRQFFADMCSENVPGYWLTLCGCSGTGKTWLAKIIRRLFTRYFETYRDERYPEDYVFRKGAFVQWSNQVNQMLDGDFSRLRQMGQDWFICLDDIASEYQGGMVRDLSTAKLYDVLNDRLGLFTLITVNFSAEAIAERLDTRIGSRLLRNGSVIYDMTTIDYATR